VDSLEPGTNDVHVSQPFFGTAQTDIAYMQLTVRAVQLAPSVTDVDWL